MTLHANAYYVSFAHGTITDILIFESLADPGGGTPGAPPPNGRGPTIFYAQNANFLNIFFARFARDTF